MSGDGRSERILVTGGAGFIGSALVWALNRRGYEDVVVADHLGSDEKWRNLVPLRYSDYIDAEELRWQVEDDGGALGKFDFIYHLGACSATTEKDAAYLMRNNYGYTRMLSEWALETGARFVYASSAATYGDGSQGMEDGEANIDELRPLNMYGYSKHLFDLHARREGLLESIVGLKYFNVFGPNEDHKDDMRSVVNKAFGQIRDTGKVGLFKSYRDDYEDGKQMRDFLYVKDAVEMTIHLAETDGASGLFNIGSGVANTWLDLAEAIFGALGTEPNIEFVEMPEALRDKYQYFTKATIETLRKSGYEEPITSLEDAVRDYVQGYLVDDLRLGDEKGEGS
ncbi:MAG: ADP-glyceromanno-heptose 6-epimerase [Verrucomicrobiota bacterium]